MTTTTITVQPLSRSHAIFAPAGSLVSIAPGSGGTMMLEYTLASAADIRNNVAAWSAWPAGTVSALSKAVCNKNMHLRGWAYTATGTVSVVDEPTASDVADLTTDWAIPSSPATMTQTLGNVSGALVIDLSKGWNIFMTVTGNITSMTFTNGPSTGNAARVAFQITNGGAFSITWPAGIRWNGAGVVGSAPTLQASGVENVVNTISNPAGTTLIGGYYLGREV